MDKFQELSKLVELCNERKALFNSFNLYSEFIMDDKYKEVTQKINRLAKRLEVYAITSGIIDSETKVAFKSLVAMKKVTGDEPLSVSYHEKTDCNRYSASFYDGELTLFCFEGISEEHKKAQAI